MPRNFGLRLSLATLFVSIVPTAAAVGETPRLWQMDMQPPATEVMQRIHDFHDMLLVVITLIALFVTGLLIYVMWRFSEKRNPTPSRTTHNTFIEVIWTVVPVIILVIIAIPSFRLLYFQEVVPKSDMTIKAIGHQWYWSYQYPDHGNFEFDSNMVADDELKPGQPRLLAVDNRIVVPVYTTVRLIVTADDVLHAWAMPAFGIKIDAVPGRLNETWFRAERTGTFYGQCSELCGVNHGFMPIRVDVVSAEQFADWVASARQEFADAGTAGVRTLAQVPAAAR